MKRSDFVDNDNDVRVKYGDHSHWLPTDRLKLGDTIEECDSDNKWVVTFLSPTHFTVTRDSDSFTFPINEDGSPVTFSPDDPKQTSPVTDCTDHIKHQCYREIITAIRAVYDEMCTWPKDCRSYEALMVEIQAAILDRVLGGCSDE